MLACSGVRAEAIGCPGPTRFLDALENIFYSSRKLFLVISSKFLTCSPKLSNFTKIRSLDAPPPSASSCPSNYIFLFFFVIYIPFFKENWPLGCPHAGWMPGAVRTPSARHCCRATFPVLFINSSRLSSLAEPELGAPLSNYLEGALCKLIDR